MLTHGIIKNPEQDVDDATDTTCVGVDLISGSSWAPPAKRTWEMLDALLDLCHHKKIIAGGGCSLSGCNTVV